MKVGTKSVLFGVHQFLLHPWFVAWAWWSLYGFPWDPRLWVAFLVHDWGYWGKPNMDGPEGEQHIRAGANLMGWLFDADYILAGRIARTLGGACNWIWGKPAESWYCLAFYHSRYASKRYGRPPSRLCAADKLAIALMPWWMYLPLAQLSGELGEYLSRAVIRAAHNEALNPKERSAVTLGNARAWFAGVQDYMRRWVEKHKDGSVDTWTASGRPDCR